MHPGPLPDQLFVCSDCDTTEAMSLLIGKECYHEGVASCWNLSSLVVELPALVLRTNFLNPLVIIVDKQRNETLWTEQRRSITADMLSSCYSWHLLQDKILATSFSTTFHVVHARTNMTNRLSILRDRVL